MKNEKINGTDISLFLNTIYSGIADDCYINIIFKRPSNQGMPATSYKLNDLPKAIEDIQTRSKGKDVYFEVCPQMEAAVDGTRGKSEGVAVVPAFWMDIDVKGGNHKGTDYPTTLEEALEFLHALPWTPTIIIGTGGGAHVYYLLSEPQKVDNDEVRKNRSGLSKSFQSYIIQQGKKQNNWKFDATHDLARVLRVPGTHNQKPVARGEAPQEVKILEFNPEATYTLEDFQEIVDQEVLVGEVVENKTELITQQNTPIVPSDYPEADIELIETHCGWMAHCNYDADTLPEPEWFAACSIWCRCSDGREVAHERSKPYSGYDVTETNKKVDNALNGAPRTCDSVLIDLGASKYCDNCFLNGKGKSPISLGNPDPITQANIKISKVALNSNFNPKDVFEDDNLAALALLKFKSPGDFANAKNVLKKAGVAKGELTPALDRFIATHEMSFDEAANYEVISGCLYVNKATVQGMTPVKLAEFNATITEEIIKQDGATSERYYKVEGTLKTGGSLDSITLPVQEFETMGWIGSAWGAKAWYAAGAGTKDNIRAAITYLSDNIQTNYIFTHTGWTTVEGEWVFLTEAGAIAEDKAIGTYSVDLSDSNLSDYCLPEPPDEFITADAFKKCLLLLDLLPNHISYPLLSAVFRAPLGGVLPITFALFIAGATGTRKSEVSSIAQGFYGQAFNGKNLPANWASTANALEKLTFQTKDVVVVADDYLPGDNPRQMNAKADRLIRAAGNQGGRQRMTADTSFRQEYYPRGLIICTGEDIPTGQSLTGRMLVLEIAEGDVNLDVLTQLQGYVRSGVFSNLMHMFLKWLAPQMGSLKDYLSSHRADLRSQVVKTEQTHTRTPEIVADLIIGFQSLCSYGQFLGVLDSNQAEQMQDDCRLSLIEAANKQQSQQNDSDPCERFKELLMAAFVMGKVHLENISEGFPHNNAERWGWQLSHGTLDDTGVPKVEYYKQGAKIGWVDGQYVYLNSEAAFKTAQDVGGNNRPITISLKTLRLRLAERGHLFKGTDGGLTQRLNIVKGRPRVMKIDVSFFDDDEENVSSTVPEFNPQEATAVSI